MTISDSLGGVYSMHYLDTSLQGLELSHHDRFIVALQKHNINLGPLHNFRRAAAYADTVLAVALDKRYPIDTNLLFKAYLAKANIAYVREVYDTAFNYYDKAKELAALSGSPCMEFSYLFRIAMAYFREEKFLSSARVFNEAWQKSLNCDHTNMPHIYRQQEVLGNIGLAYARANMLDSATSFYRKALNFIVLKAGNFPNLAYKWDEATSVIQGNMGSAYMEAKEPDSAEFYLLASIAMNKRSGMNLRDRQFNIIKLANLYTSQKQFSKALSCINLGDSVNALRMDDVPLDDNTEPDFRMAEARWLYYNARGLYPEAIKWLQKRDAIKAVRLEHTNKMLSNDLQAGIEASNFEKQILSLEKDVQIGRQQKIILFLTVILSLGALALIIYALRHYVRRYRLLEEDHHTVRKESARKEKMLHKKIREDELNFVALIENTDDFLWSVDSNYNLLACNKAYRDYYQKITGQIQKTGNPEVIADHDPKYYEKIKSGYKTVFSGTSHEIIETGIAVNGIAPDVEVRFKPICNESGEVTGVSCFRRDITEYKHLISTLEKNNKQLLDIAWTQSHKLRGPLSTMMGIISVLFSDTAISEEERTILLDSLKEKANEMDLIIHEIVKMTE